MKIALVYDRINKWGGAERLLLALHRVFPSAPVFTSVYEPSASLWAKKLKIIPSALNSIPFFRSRHQQIPFLMPFAFESMDFFGYDIVISVTSAEAKGILTAPETMHVCYCLTPTRYLYSHRDDYLQSTGQKKFKGWILNQLGKWDQVACRRPDYYLAISETVRQRIKTYYHQEADVIYPPVTIPKIRDQKLKIKIEKTKFFLIVSRLEPYKKVEVAIEAFNQLNLPLVIIGTGSQERKLKSLARSNINFVRNLTDDELFDYYRSCRALIMPQEEDFGLVSLEAQSFYRPVLAYRLGGASETISEYKTGLFFDHQTIDDMIIGIRKITKMQINIKYFDQNLSRFTFDHFKSKFIQSVKEQWAKHKQQI